MGSGHTLPDPGEAFGMTLPNWPRIPPAHGAIQLRPVERRDVDMARKLSTDPYVPLTGSLPGNASRAEASSWVRRQQGRHAEGRGFSFAIARQDDDYAVGHCGLWLKDLDTGRATAGYAIVPSDRGCGYAADALSALTEFGLSIPEVLRIDLYIEPWNVPSLRTAERGGYLRGQLVVGHQAIGGRLRDMIEYSTPIRRPSDE